MSQENVDVVRRAYEALAHEGLDRFMEHFTDNVEYRAVSGAPDDIGPIHGKNASEHGSRSGSTCSTGSRWSCLARGREYVTREQALEAAGCGSR
jgi:hypothetical protein